MTPLSGSGTFQSLVASPQAASRRKTKNSCLTSTCIYVTNTLADNDCSSVTVYPATATGNVKPLEMIAGSNTGLAGCFGIAVDTQHDIYVSNRDIMPSGSSITVYSPGATGNIAPIRTISGSATD
jgi:hypothetical protein